MIVNTVAIDWLTLTSFNPWDWEEFQRVVFDCEEGRLTQKRRMQFKGIGGNSMFTGAARINERETFMIQASGHMAQKAALMLADSMPGQCTRIDLQITVPLPINYSARILADGLRWSSWVGHKRPVELREGEEEFDTVYIGRRTAGDFTRVYVKSDGDQLWLRFETQFQKRKAVKVWPAVARNRVMMGKILRGRVDALPEITDEVGLQAIRSAIDFSPINVTALRRVTGEESTYMWLRDVVSPVVVRLLNDHDYGERVAALVRDWELYI